VKHLKGEDLIEDSLKALEEEFTASFVRIHRNALVNTRFLERIARDASGQHFVHLRGFPDALEVSRRMAGDLKDRFRI
jgi:two-component system response regulator AlgR